MVEEHLERTVIRDIAFGANRKRPRGAYTVFCYCSFACSALACSIIRMSGSASFQTVRKSLWEASARTLQIGLGYRLLLIIAHHDSSRHFQNNEVRLHHRTCLPSLDLSFDIRNHS